MTGENYETTPNDRGAYRGFAVCNFVKMKDGWKLVHAQITDIKGGAKPEAKADDKAGEKDDAKADDKADNKKDAPAGNANSGDKK